MSDDKKGTSQVSQFVKRLTEISGYAIGIAAYIAALTGRIETEFSETVAILTLIGTTGALWAWRWPQVSRRKPGARGKVEKEEGSGINAFLERLTSPVRSSSKEGYALPLFQRRIEMALMAVLAAITAGRTVVAIRPVMKELNPPAFEWACDQVPKPNEAKVVIADFYEAPGGEVLFEERLYDDMLAQFNGEARICRLKQVVEGRLQAEAVQDEIDAAVLVWGRSDQDGVDVHLEVQGLDVVGKKIWSYRGDESDFQSTESPHLTFLARYSINLLRYVNGRYEQAISGLRSALSEAEGQSWTTVGDNNTDLADAHFLAGLSYERYEALPEQERYENARDQYSEAIRLDPQADDAILDRGRVCVELGDIDCAKEDYSTLIERGSDLAATAYINRSYLQSTTALEEQDLDAAVALDPTQGIPARGEARLSWGDYTGAIADLQIAIQATPDYPYLYHYLGTAQLLSGDFEGATKTYKAVIPYLDEGYRGVFIDDLSTLSPPPALGNGFEETVSQIVNSLEEAKLP
jgi:tetratricopeptide (TPR) repeat protein